MSSKAPVNHGLRRLNLGIVMMLSASATSGYNASQINSLLVLPQFTEFLGVLSSSAEGLVIAAVSLGAFLTFVPAAYTADKLGRKKAVLIGSTLCIIASILQTAVKHPWVFFAARVLTGSGVAFSQTAAPLLIAETAYPSQRPTLTGLYNSVWFCGSITAAAIAFGTLTIDNSWSWRVPCLLQVLYPCLQLVALLIIPESPRWLVSKNRQGEALAMLTRYHGNGDIHNEMVQEEYDQICASIHAEADQKAASQWSAFFKTRGDIHRLVICILLGFMQEWTGNGVTSYYLPPILASVGITNAVHEAAVNISLQFWNLIFAVSGASLSNRVGRRTLWLSATSLMIIFLAAATVMSGVFAQMHIIQAGIAVVPLLFCFNAAFDFAYMPLFIAYPAEILPFQLRAKGLAVTLTTDSLACFFNQYVNPVAFAALRWRYFSIYVGCLVVVIALVYFFFPETQGRSLEEVAQIFETPKLKDKEANMSDSDVSKSSFVIKYEE